MKRYNCTLSDKRGAFGLCMEEHKEGLFVSFSEVDGLRAQIQHLLEERSSSGRAIDKAILSGIVPEQHSMRSRLELLANHRKRELALADALREARNSVMNVAGLLRKKEAPGLGNRHFELADRIDALLAGQVPAPQDNRAITLMMSELHDIIVGLDVPGGAQNSAEVWEQVIAARDRVQVSLSCGRPDAVWTDATSAPTEQDYRELQAQHDQVQSRLKAALDLLRETRPSIVFEVEDGELAADAVERIDALLAGQVPALVNGRTITEGQEFELSTVLQSIANGFSDDPAHDAAALLKRIAGEVPWTGNSFQLPPRQGG